MELVVAGRHHHSRTQSGERQKVAVASQRHVERQRTGAMAELLKKGLSVPVEARGVKEALKAKEVKENANAERAQGGEKIKAEADKFSLSPEAQKEPNLAVFNNDSGAIAAHKPVKKVRIVTAGSPRSGVRTACPAALWEL